MVEAYIEGSESGTLQRGEYDFVPNRFEISDSVQSVIANQATTITIQALQCDESGNPAPISDDLYSGDKELELSITSYEAPTTLDLNVAEVISVKDRSDNWIAAPNSALELRFNSSASAETEVIYPEAGSVSYTLTDQVCITNDDNEQECEDIVGIQQLDARPWTFAICHDEKSLTGTSSSGDLDIDAFAAAGEFFTLNLHPLRYITGATDSATIDVTTLCGEAETQNFFGFDAPLGSAKLESTAIDSPTGGEIGDGILGTTETTNEDQSSIVLNDLSWNDVGSLVVSASGAYLGDIKPGVRAIGRFYPKYLSAEDNVDHPTEHSSFAYMNQPLQHQFSVFAHAVDGTKVQNYHLFSPNYASEIQYIAQTSSAEDLVDRLFDDGSAITTIYPVNNWVKTTPSDGENPYSQLAVNFDAFSFMRTPILAETTFTDGPYTDSNTDFGLDVSRVFDGVSWQTAIELTDEITQFVALQSAYDFRYGRMALDDVAGNSGQGLTGSALIIPLTVEYWNGDRFIQNSSDGSTLAVGSTYNGEYHCVQQIWLDSGASVASFNGIGGVINGAASEQSIPSSSLLYGSHSNSSVREQIRMWLRIGSQEPQKVASIDPEINCPVNNYTNRPWLRYNWRNLGDEDPSAVITFGTFRGNDRVIYRGERGLTGN
jgi:MSHA biogenesis protein MshQ